MAKSNSSLWVYLTVLLAVGVALAMTPLTRAQQSGSQSQADQNQKAITATGCLQKDSSGSGYQLTDSASNKTYNLTASSSDVDLSAHVGHTVTVTGTPNSASASNSGSSSSSTTNPGSQANANPSGSMSSPEQISVTNVKMVSSTCQGQ